MLLQILQRTLTMAPKFDGNFCIEGQIFSSNCQTGPSELEAHFCETKSLEHEFLQIGFCQKKNKSNTEYVEYVDEPQRAFYAVPIKRAKL